MAGVSVVEKLARKDDLILVLNSGSSSLKFGIYYRGASDEEPLLTGSADGIGRGNGTLAHSFFRRKTARCNAKASSNRKATPSPLSRRQFRSIFTPRPSQ